MTNDDNALEDFRSDTDQSTEFAGSDMQKPTNEQVPAPLDSDNDTGTEAITPEEPAGEADDIVLNDVDEEDLDDDGDEYDDSVDDTADDAVDDSVDQSGVEPGVLSGPG